jgi:aminobenzoyl-glutamate utilization protein B
MKLFAHTFILCAFVAAVHYTYAQKSPKLSAEKKAIFSSVDKHSSELIALSDSIWLYAETSLKEYRSSKILSDYAEQQGFKVQRGVAGMPTAFIASYGEGRPIIGVLGEYDALPGMSQKASAREEPLIEGGAGHGCGHNLFGPGSLGAAIAIKELIEQGKVKGTVRFYGTPAEEAYGGKVYMARDGLFNDLDACFDWHPDYQTKADLDGSLSMVDVSVSFTGMAAHAASNPWDGKSALDAAELFTHGINMMREHLKPTARVHYVFSDGGDAPNIVPAHAALWLWIRDTKQASVEQIYERVKKMAEGAAMMAGVQHSIRLITGDYEMLTNVTGCKALHDNLMLLGPITYTKEEIAFAKEMQTSFGLDTTGINGVVQPFKEIVDDPETGSTDVADVSWCTPDISLIVTTTPDRVPSHSWPVVASGGMSIGHKGMLYAAKAMAFTMLDLYQQPELLAAVRKEFIEKKGDRVFKAMLPDGPPPVPAE